MGIKFGWDETGLRMYLGVRTVRSLLPRFDFAEPDAAEVEARAKRGVGTRPSYIVQIMQSSGAVFVGGRMAETLVTPPKIVRSVLVLKKKQYIKRNNTNENK